MAWGSRHGDSEWSLWEAVKVKRGLCWRDRDVGDARAVGYLPELYVYILHTGSGASPGERNDGRAEPSRSLDTGHGVTVFGVCPPGFQFLVLVLKFLTTSLFLRLELQCIFWAIVC